MSTIDLARSVGLRVQLTLFDWWQSYTDWVGSDRWSTAVLSKLHNSREVAFIEVQNEINPSNTTAMKWARHELVHVQSEAGSIPVTISVNDSGASGSERLSQLKVGLGTAQPTFYDVHFYNPYGEALTELRDDLAIASPLPLFIGETGYPSSESIKGSGGSLKSTLGEDFQDLYLRGVEWAVQALGLPIAAPWIYQDFTQHAIPRHGKVNRSEYSYGLFRDDGTEKPAGVSIRTLFKTGAVSRSFNNGFEIGAGGEPADWMRIGQALGSLSWDPTTSHQGDASVRLSHTSGTATLTPSFVVVPVIGILQTGEIFTLTAWTMGRDVSGLNRVAIGWFNSQGKFLFQSTSHSIRSGSFSWRRASVSAAAPLGAAFPELILESSNNAGTVWFDDVTFASAT
jgi:hypothetical protein